MKLGIICGLMFALILQYPTAGAAENKDSGNKPQDDRLRIDLWNGGWEPDYTKTAYEAMLTYQATDKLRLNGGYGNAEQVYYDRSKFFAGGYYFYEDYSYLRAHFNQKKYKYPITPGALAPNPDSSSYDKVPRYEFEVSHYFNKDLRGTVSYELSRPNFFHDTSTTITLHKLSGEAIMAASSIFRPKLYASILRDPDSKKTEIRGRDNSSTPMGVATATNVAFKSSSLLGAAVEYVESAWNAEVKYLQNRDLDDSYDYSLLSNVSYRIDNSSTLRLDHVYDKFSTDSNLSGKKANVYMASYYYQFSPGTKIGAGVKHIDVPGQTEDTGFVYLRFEPWK